MNVYIRKEETSHINHLSFHLRKLEKEQIKSIVGKIKAVIKIREEISGIETVGK